MDRHLLFLNPELREASVLRCLNFEFPLLEPAGALLTLYARTEDEYGRSLRVYHSRGGTVVNYVRCTLTGHHYVEAAGPQANLIALEFAATLGRSGLPPVVFVRDVLKLIADDPNPDARPEYASALTIAAEPVTAEAEAGWAALLEAEGTRVAVAERMGYRSSLAAAGVLERFAERDPDPTRRAFLDRFARIHRALVELGPGDATAARFEGEPLSPLDRKMLLLGSPGLQFYRPDDTDGEVGLIADEDRLRAHRAGGEQ